METNIACRAVIHESVEVSICQGVVVDDDLAPAVVVLDVDSTINDFPTKLTIIVSIPAGNIVIYLITASSVWIGTLKIDRGSVGIATLMPSIIIIG